MTPTKSFISVSATGTSAALVTISGATYSDRGSYTFDLSGTYEGSLTKHKFFDVTIHDPCSVTSFIDSPPPVPDIVVTLTSTSSGVLTQAVAVKTAVELSNSIVCGFTATMVPTVAGVSLSPDSQTISVDRSVLFGLIPQSVTSNTFTLVVQSKLYPTDVASATFTWTLTVGCTAETV